MKFIAENYLWIIIAVIFILMAIVGYVADKTGFIKKNEKADKHKKEESKEIKNEPILIDAKGINDLTNNIIKQDEPVVIDSEITPENVGDFNFDLPSDATYDNMNENVSIQNNFENIDSQENFDNQEIDESLFAPLEDSSVQDDLYQNVEEQPQDDVYQNVEELPQVDITTLENNESQDASIVNEEEDLWKF